MLRICIKGSTSPSTQKCNRCHQVLPIEDFPLKPSLVRTKRCSPCTIRAKEQDAIRKGTGPSTNKNIVPSVNNSELGTLDVKMQPQICANKPYMTITLQQMIELLQKNSKENFKLEAFVIVPSDSACATEESTREKAKALRDVIYEASEYHFK